MTQRQQPIRAMRRRPSASFAVVVLVLCLAAVTGNQAIGHRYNLFYLHIIFIHFPTFFPYPYTRVVVRLQEPGLHFYRAEAPDRWRDRERLSLPAQPGAASAD